MAQVQRPRRQGQEQASATRGGSAKASQGHLFLWGRRVVFIRDGKFVRPGRA